MSSRPGAAAFATGSTDQELAADPGTEHPEVVVGDGARAFCRLRPNNRYDCEVRFSRDNVFGLVAVLNFTDELSGITAARDLAGVMDQLIQNRP